MSDAAERQETRGRAGLFGCVIPAPNPTGDLHLGHALNLTIQDVLARWHRLNGADVVWMGALDHGATATEFVVEKDMRVRERVDGYDEEDVLLRIHSWVDSTSRRIFEQFKSLALSVDVSTQRFMHDAVRTAQMDTLVEQLIGAGYVYRDVAIVPWCPTKRSSVDESDLLMREYRVSEYKVPYKSLDGGCTLELWVEDLVSLYGDAALAVPSGSPLGVHAGKLFESPVGKRIPLVESDEFSYPDSGLVRIVPGHCPESFRWAKRIGVAIEPAWDADNLATSPPHHGHHRHEVHRRLERQLPACATARRTVVKRKRVFRVSDTPVEWYAPDQILLKLAPLKRKAKRLLEDGKVTIRPHNYQQYLSSWLDDASPCDDWPLTRQTLWGNRLPCIGRSFGARHERDVLDMKISCALWTFCANKERAADAQEYREISEASVCVTGVDLLLFWIVPILLIAGVVEERCPFSTVIVHPLVCDRKGRKMSKSVGNVVSLQSVIRKYDADTLRLCMLKTLDLGNVSLPFDEAALPEIRDKLVRLKRLARKRWAAAACRGRTARHAKRIGRYREAIAADINDLDFIGMYTHVQELMDFLLSSDEHSLAREDWRQAMDLLAVFAPSVAADLPEGRRQAPKARS